jgi:hypothetical protein
VEDDTKLRCLICDREESANIGDMLKNGWKTCCSEAMHIEETDAAAVNSALMGHRMKQNKVTNRWEIRISH